MATKKVILVTKPEKPLQIDAGDYIAIDTNMGTGLVRQLVCWSRDEWAFIDPSTGTRLSEVKSSKDSLISLYQEVFSNFRKVELVHSEADTLTFKEI